MTIETTETEGFVIWGKIPDPKPPAPPPPPPPKPHSDTFLARANEWQYDLGNGHTGLIRPIFRDGVESGRWAACRLRSRYDSPGITTPWRGFASKDEAYEWLCSSD
jgi:hypothetical protein